MNKDLDKWSNEPVFDHSKCKKIMEKRKAKRVYVMTILKNDFHQTECRTRKSPTQLEEIARLIYIGQATNEQKLLRFRIWHKLCGIQNCTCGDLYGCRPSYLVMLKNHKSMSA